MDRERKETTGSICYKYIRSGSGRPKNVYKSPNLPPGSMEWRQQISEHINLSSNTKVKHDRQKKYVEGGPPDVKTGLKLTRV